jgi:hypothetical protein
LVGNRRPDLPGAVHAAGCTLVRKRRAASMRHSRWWPGRACSMVRLGVSGSRSRSDICHCWPQGLHSVKPAPSCSPCRGVRQTAEETAGSATTSVHSQ